MYFKETRLKFQQREKGSDFIITKVLEFFLKMTILTVKMDVDAKNAPEKEEKKDWGTLISADFVSPICELE